MFLFLKLVLAHLIADFVLQFDELYKSKVKSNAGHVIHAIIHFLITALLVLPYLSHAFMWIFVTALTLIHYAQDRIKYSLQKKDEKIMFLCFVIDQIVHFLFLATIFLFPIHKLVLGFPSFPTLDHYYSWHGVTLLLILFILTAWGGAYLFFNFRKSYIPDSRPDHGITSFEMIHGIAERTFISCIFLFAPNGLYFAASPLLGLLRLSSDKLKNRLDFLLSFTYAALLGALFRLWI